MPTEPNRALVVSFAFVMRSWKWIGHTWVWVTHSVWRLVWGLITPVRKRIRHLWKNIKHAWLHVLGLALLAMLLSGTLAGAVLVNTAGASFILALFVLGFLLAIRHYFELWFYPRRIELEQCANASGLSPLDAMVPGISQLGREQLLDEGRWAREALWTGRTGLDAKRPDAPEWFQVLNELPLPDEARESGSDRIEALLPLFAPQNTGAMVHVFNRLIPTTEATVVRTTLQRRCAHGDTGQYSQLGITCEVAKSYHLGEAKIFTLWEVDQPRLRQGRGAKVPAWLPYADGSLPGDEPYLMLATRYDHLLELAMAWLAIVLITAILESEIRKWAPRSQRNHALAELYDIVGRMFLVVALTRGCSKFLDLAIHNLTKATKLEDKWADVHYDLANMYRALAMTQPPAEGMASQVQAIEEYTRAHNLLQEQQQLQQQQPPLYKHVAKQVANLTHKLIEPAYLVVKTPLLKPVRDTTHRAFDTARKQVEGAQPPHDPRGEPRGEPRVTLEAIDLGTASTQLLTGEQWARKRAVDTIEATATKRDGDGSSDTTIGSLYNLACACCIAWRYGQLDEERNTLMLERARRYLAYAMARNHEHVLPLAQHDPELEAFHSELPDLHYAILNVLGQGVELNSALGAEFIGAMLEVLQGIGWA